MKALVTTKGQVTIPQALREQFDIQPGVEVDFTAAADGIRLRKIVPEDASLRVFGCLKEELMGRSVEQWMDDLRGPVEFPPRPKRRRAKQA